jgi:hypothetical protein
VARCGQELCDYWTGDACGCDLLDLRKACPDCDDDEGMQHSPWDGWSCSICDWQENPL